ESAPPPCLTPSRWRLRSAARARWCAALALKSSLCVSRCDSISSMRSSGPRAGKIAEASGRAQDATLRQEHEANDRASRGGGEGGEVHACRDSVTTGVGAVPGRDAGGV